jgi:hypothetical protein
MLHFGLPTAGVTLSVLSHSVLTGNTHVAKPQAIAVRDIYAKGCRQLSNLAGRSKVLLTPRSPRTHVSFNWPRLTRAGLARKVGDIERWAADACRDLGGGSSRR